MSDRSPIQPAEIVWVPFNGTHIPAVDVDGAPYVILKPLVESIGIDYWTQVEKLRRKSWACTGQRLVQLTGDTQRRAMVVVNVRTFVMLLATVDEGRVSEEARAGLIAYQARSAQALEDFWLGRTSVPAQRAEPTRRDLARMVIEAEDRADAEALRADAAETKVAAIEPAATAWQHLASAEGDFLVGDAAKILQRDPTIKAGGRARPNELFKTLQSMGLVYKRGKRDRWHAMQWAVDKGWLVHRGQYFYDADGVKHTGDPQVRLTVDGIYELFGRLGGTAPLSLDGPDEGPTQLELSGGAG